MTIVVFLVLRRGGVNPNLFPLLPSLVIEAFLDDLNPSGAILDVCAYVLGHQLAQEPVRGRGMATQH